MTKKARAHATITVPVHPTGPDSTLPNDPINVRIVRRELHRLEHRIIEQNGDITALRRLLSNSTVEELWEVPG